MSRVKDIAVKCFRDEDLRADRQPEFTQVDIETSFLKEEEIREIMENLIRRVFKQVLDVDLAKEGERFLVMPYKQAMADYGSDKPDLRVKLKLVEVTDIVANSEFKVFTSVKSIHNGKVVALRVPGASAMPRSEIDGYTEYVKIYGAKGLAYIKINDVTAGREGMQGPVVKNLSDEVVAKIVEVTGAQSGDVIFFGADKAKIVYDSLGALRLKIGHSEFGKANGLFLKCDLTFNTTIANLEQYKTGLALSNPKMVKATNKEIKIMRTKCMGPDDMISSLSGGNQQKVIFGKWLEREPQVFMMDEPTRGIDVGAKYEIYELIINMAKQGKTIIVVSSEMPEILGITNRIGVMSNGHLSGIVNTKETDQEELLRLSAKYL